MTNLKRHIVAVLFSAMLLSLAPASLYAQTMDVPADIQVRLFSKLLTYDRNLPVRAGSHIVFGIFYQRTFKGSSAAKDDILKALSTASVSSMGGIPFSVELVELDDPSDIAATIAARNIGLAYIAPLRAFDLETILAASRATKVLTLTGVSAYADRGVSVAIGMQNQHPQILINLPSARAEGADFNSHFLKLVRIVQ